MPKKLEPLILKDTDAKLLTSIADGTTPAGDDIVKRAKVLLMLSEGKKAKEIAKAIPMRENSVGDIRRRYIKNGISSLRDTERSGRPSKLAKASEVDGRIDLFLAQYQAEHNEMPSVRTIAVELNASKSTVRDALRARGLLKERKRSWEFITSGTPDAMIIDIVGIYLSASQQVMIVRTSSEGSLPVSETKGTITTADSTAAESLKKTAEEDLHIELVDALAAFTEAGAETKKSKAKDCYSFICSVIAENRAGDNDRFYLLACGSPVIDSDRLVIPDAVLEHAEDIAMWTAKTENLLKLLYSADHDAELSMNLADSMEQYIRRASDQTPAFTWKKGMTADKSLSSEEEETPPAPGTIEFEARIMGDDGQWITYRIQADTHQTEESFDTSTRKGYMKSANKIEKTIADLSHEAARGINQKYLNDVAKKKTPPVTSL